MNSDNLTLLGGLSVEKFLREYWQKKPLLIRQAIPGFKGLLSPVELLDLACNPDAQSRLVQFRRKKWLLDHGPFDPSQISALDKSRWTVLVQGINHFLPEAAKLLQQFSFIPHARLDDLMVSYAPRDGGVGPHFDSYDVFLLQGLGQRRWQISAQKDRSLIPDAPLRILQNFTPEHEWILEAGDMLYLPPHWAHNGIAENDCMTYSIGFRTPSHHELAEQFLIYLQDRIELDGMYADPDLNSQAHPSEISDAMLDKVSHVINQIKWDKEDIANFLGAYLSEPKSHIFFDPPEKPLSEARFRQQAVKKGVSLDLKTQMLCRGKTIFINGEPVQIAGTDFKHLRTLADTRTIKAGTPLTDNTIHLLHQWYLEGYLFAADM